jgi:predicted GIY-YIG superfamily endonuclease
MGRIKLYDSPFYKDIESNICGVYFIYFKNNHLYIGSSGDLRQRINSHVSKMDEIYRKNRIYKMQE